MLQQVQSKGAPLIHGDRVTFVWQGDTVPALIGDFNDWLRDRPPQALQRLGTDLWACSLTFPLDSYIEYAFLVEGRHRVDPLNRGPVEKGLGVYNSAFWMPGATDTTLARARPGVPRGRVSRHQAPTRGYLADATRTVRLYQPPVSQPCPLLIVLDGQGYYQRAKLTTIMDNLIGAGRIRPLALALVDAPRRGRTGEYACSDTTVAFLLHAVLPLAEEHLSVVDYRNAPGAHGLMGASMGGLMSLYAALRAPETFGAVLCQSGAFFADHLYFRSVLNDLVRLQPPPPCRIWMDAGRNEWYLEPNRRMSALLAQHGYNVRYLEHNSGHNYPSWRNSLWRGLEHLFPPIATASR